MTHLKRYAHLRLASVPALVGFALVLSFSFCQSAQPVIPYLFLASVVASAWLAGRIAGLIGAILAGLTLGYSFLLPLHTLGIGAVAIQYAVPFLLSVLAAAWISTLHRRRDEVRTKNLSLGTAVEQAAQGIMITDTDGTIEYVNLAFTKMTGYTSAEAVGQTPRMLKSTWQDASYYSDLWQTIRSGQVWHGELINRRKDKTVYTERMTIAPVRDRSGKIVDFIALKEDVTQRIALEERHAFLAAVVENSVDAIVTFTPAGIIRSWNHGAQLLLGYSEKEVMSRHALMPFMKRPHTSDKKRKNEGDMGCGQRVFKFEQSCFS